MLFCIWTAAGTGTDAEFNHPQGITIDRERNVYVADTQNHAIRMITPLGVVTTVAGTGENDPFRDGEGSQATFSHPGSITNYYDYANDAGKEKLPLFSYLLLLFSSPRNSAALLIAPLLI